MPMWGRRFRLPTRFAALCLLACCALAAVNNPQLPALMPMPAAISMAEGKLVVDASFSVTIGSASSTERYHDRHSCQIVTLPSGRGSEERTERSWLDKGHLRFDQHQDPPLQREYRHTPGPADARKFHGYGNNQQRL